jgi:hypothetical protein
LGVRTVVPPPDPILATLPYAWFRADTFSESAGLATALTGRVGTEGNVGLGGGSGAITPSNPLANNQPTIQIGTNSINLSTMPTSFWGLLNSDLFSWWCVFVCAPADPQSILRAGSDFRFLCDLSGFDMVIEWGPGGDNAALPLALPVPSTCVLTRSVAPDASANPVAAFADSPVVGFRGNNSSFAYAPPATVDGTLQIGDAETPAFDIAELLIYDRAIDVGNPDYDVVSLYFQNRYGLIA